MEWTARFHTTGPAHEVIALEHLEHKELKEGEVRLRMRFAPINPADLNLISGTYGTKPQRPAVPGMEGCGIIEAVGPGAESLPVGRLAMPLRPSGCWAESIVLPARDILCLPEGLDPQQAAMLRVNPATAWGLLHSHGLPAPGSWILQNAASSAAAHCVIGLARHLGLRSLSLVRRPESAAACLAAGADAVLPDDEEALAAAAAIPGFHPAALGLNAVGGDSALRLMNLLQPGGRLLTYGAMGRQPLKVPNGLLIFKGLELSGFWLTRWLASFPEEEGHKLYTQLAQLVAAGIIHQPVAAVYPLSSVTEALRHAASAGRSGKILLQLG
jgi:trans-2-enoyl-CoA reductase